jgi:5-formyltetrahydrofolate cyclo-ligase
MQTDMSPKAILRRRVLTLRDQLSRQQRTVFERRLLAGFLDLPEIRELHCFFVYCSYRSEVDTELLIAQLLLMGKDVSIPLTDTSPGTMRAVRVTNPKTQLRLGYKGIPEPDPALIPGNLCTPESLDVAIIPGSVFDEQGYRLGYGSGYYDRFLIRAPQALRIGLAFSLQLVRRIPHLPHDVPMDVLVTEKGVTRWPRTGI